MAKKLETQSNNPQGLLAKVGQQKFLLRTLLYMTYFSVVMTLIGVVYAVMLAVTTTQEKAKWASTGLIFAILCIITSTVVVVIRGVLDAAKTVTITRERLSKILSPYAAVLTFQALTYVHFFLTLPINDPASASESLVYVLRLLTDDGKYLFTGLFLTLAYLLGPGLTPFCALRDEVEQARKTSTTTPSKKKR